MAKQKKRKPKRQPQKKSKPTALNWPEILMGALIDSLVGTLLILISKLMD